tara:strand:+ start:245 stop:499 length:255 start_codon:yes stop_codon:yes gene_type:complete
LSFSSELESANGFGNWFMEELQKKGNDLSGFIVELGKSLNLNWDVFYTGFGEIIEDSWNSEIVELIEFNDKLIEKLKTTPQHRV